MGDEWEMNRKCYQETINEMIQLLISRDLSRLKSRRKRGTAFPDLFIFSRVSPEGRRRGVEKMNFLS